jgi:hypothetical protein
MYQTDPSPRVQQLRDRVIAERDEPGGVERVDDSLRERYREVGRGEAMSALAVDMHSELERSIDLALGEPSRRTRVESMNAELAVEQAHDTAIRVGQP